MVAVELHPGRARELEENCRLLGADNVTVVNADATKLPARADRLRPCARRRAVLRSRRARRPARPALARAAAARAPDRAPAGRGRARQARRHDRLLGLHAGPRGERGRSSTPPACRSSRSVMSGRSSDIRGGPSSCSRSRTCTGQRASSSPASEPRLARAGLERLDQNGRGRAVALRGRLLAARRADRGAAAGGRARLSLRRRRRPLRRADHDRPDRPPVDLADHSRRAVVRRLPSHDGDAGEALRPIKRAGGDSVTVHYEACPDLPPVVLGRARSICRSASRSSRRRAPHTRRTRRSRRA